MPNVCFLQVGARNNVSDMEKDPFYNFIQKTYPIHPTMMAVALYALGGFPYIVWGMVISQLPFVGCVWTGAFISRSLLCVFSFFIVIPFLV